MAYRNLMVSLVLALAIVAIAAQTVSAFGTIDRVEVNGINTNGINVAEISGHKVPVLVVFTATQDAQDVRVKVWITGEKDNAAVSSRQDVLAGRVYAWTVLLDVPSDLNDRTNEGRKIEISVENRDSVADIESVSFTVQRESYQLEIISVGMNSEVKAGETLLADVVLKNRGSRFADDTFIRFRIPELGVEGGSYFGDLSALDQGGNVADKEDATERRLALKIPSSVRPGVYTVEFEAYNSDSSTRVERRIAVLSSSADSRVVASADSKTFAVGEKGEYKLTLVNGGNSVAIYDVSVSSSSGVNLDVSDPVVVVPAGSSRTVTVFAEAMKEGDYTFSVVVKSDNGQTITEKTFRAVVQGNETKKETQNATLLLTVVLAIVFVVLLVVLIVLLTRKPEKTEEMSESYY